MKKLYLIILIAAVSLQGIVVFGNDTNTKQKDGKSMGIVEKIGFIHSFISDDLTGDDEVEIGVDSYGEAFYKICSSDGESIVKGGLLNRGLNIIGIPVELITGKNKGVFFFFAKDSEQITGKQIILLPDRIETIDADPEIEDSDAVGDRYKHEIIVTGEDNRFNDYASRVTLDSVTGDYPALSQGIPVLPLVYLFITKIVHSIKKNRKRKSCLFSETEIYVKQKKDKGKSSLLNLRIFISEM